MTTRKNKLELTWIGKEHRPKLEPRILLEDPANSYHAAHQVTDHDQFDNRLIQGDNLLALKALEQEFTGKIKCIYIDPPFNTQQAFEHYQDETEHSDWLRLMRDRLELLRRLMMPNGTIFVHIDDNELGYLLVLMDEVFGRANKLYVVTFKQGSATGHKAINPGCANTTNFLLLYAKDKSQWQPNRLFTARERDDRYGQFIENAKDQFSEWRITTLTKAFATSLGLPEKEARAVIKAQPEKLDTFVINNAGSVIQLAQPNYEGVGAETRKLIDHSKSNPNDIYCLERDGYSKIYLKGGKRLLFYTDKLKFIDGHWVAGEPLTTLWEDILSNNIHAEGGIEFPKGKKPEGLLKRVFELSTQPGDLVLDSFGGSGTTGAVAHKMGRRWIMVELGPHCQTHILPRLKSVINGADPGGVTQATNWQGGGGFRFYQLAPSLIIEDRWGNPIINRHFNAAMLAEAVCKLEGYIYAPSDSVYWQQGRASETSFLYVTTQRLSREQLRALDDEVGTGRSLLVCCAAFTGKAEEFPNLELKKIPKAVLTKCEWGHDDYSLRVENLPKAPPKPGQQDLFADLGTEAAQ